MTADSLNGRYRRTVEMFPDGAAEGQSRHPTGFLSLSATRNFRAVAVLPRIAEWRAAA